MKNNKKGIILGAVSIIITCLIVGIHIGNKVYRVGFFPGLVMSIIGIIITNKNKDKYKTKVSLILNIIALIISILSMIMSITNGIVVSK